MDSKIEYFDICIIGGSIAGNYLSYLLSKTDLKIAVIEEHDEIGLPFQCAGIISKKLSELIELPEVIVLNRVEIARLVAPSGKFIKISGEEQPYIVDRVALDKIFYDKVKDEQNITYFLGEKFKSFKYVQKNRQKHVLIKTSKRQLEVKILIGCDGPLSSVGRTLGVINKTIYGTQIRIKGNFDQNEALMYFDPRWKELFGWIVPEGKNIYRIGLASSKNPAKNLKILLKKFQVNIEEKIDQQGGIIPIGTMNRAAFDNVLLLGDSACQVKATTGGGIVMLLSAAKHAASCIERCFQASDFSIKFIKRYYVKPCLISIGKQLKLHYIIRIVFEKFTNKDFESFFQIIKTNNIEEIISFYGDMDFPRELIFQMLKNPIVIKFLLRFILRNPITLLKIIKILL
jgi:geranylgeranyl reductase family protein